MRRLIVVALLASALAFADLSMSTFFITSFDPLNGSVDTFPIFYLTYKPNDEITLKYTQYGSVLDLQNPKYYYIEYRNKFGPVLLNVDLGKARMKKSYTYQLNLVRVGGMKIDYTGVGGFIRRGIFEIGAFYDYQNGYYGAYGSVYTDLLKGGIYYETRYNELGADLKLSTSFADIWAGVSAKKDSLSDPTVLIGGRTDLFGIRLEGQYVWKGSGYVEILRSDPNKVAGKWLLDLAASKSFGGYELGLYFKNNSAFMGEGTFLLAAKLKVGDLEIHGKIYGEDLNPNLPGDQNLMIIWNHYFRYDFGAVSAPMVPSKSEKTEVKKEGFSPKRVTVLEIKKTKPKSLISIKGVVTSPLNLLGKKSFYVKDPTGGIMVYVPSGGVDVKVGDMVEIVGNFKEYYGMPEIVAKEVKKMGSVEIRSVPIFTEKPSYETLGNLVKIEGVVIRKGKYDFDVQYAENLVIKVYIKKGTGIKIGQIKVGDKVEVTGIMYIYKGKYEILPRFPEDIVLK